MELVTIISFVGASVLLTLAPGPDILYVMTQSITQDKKAGIFTALGLCSGVLIHTTAAAIGISAILYSSTAIFNGVKLIGASYLLYLAYKEFRSKSEESDILKGEVLDYSKLYKKGVLMNVLNPKVALFFLALLPQFINENGINVGIQMIILGIVFMIQAFAIFSLIAFFSGTIGDKLLKNKKIASKFNLIKGSVYAVIGINIALSNK